MYDGSTMGPEGEQDREKQNQLSQKRQIEIDRRKRKQAEKARKRTSKQLKRRLDRTNKRLTPFWMALQKEKRAKSHLQKLYRKSPELAEMGIRQAIFYSVVVLLPVIVIFFNMVLISAPVAYIVGNNVGNKFFAEFATVAVPLGLIIWQLVLSALPRWSEIDTNTLPLKMVSWGLILISPALILATAFTKDDVLSLDNIFATVALIVLSLGIDMTIVFFGNHLYDAIAYFWFQLSKSMLEFKVLRSQRHTMNRGRLVTTSFDEYLQLLTEYNNEYPNTPIHLNAFSDRFRRGVNHAYGFQVIPQNNYPAIDREFSNTTTNYEPTDEAGDEAESEYLKDLDQDQIYRDEREIQP
jgi:hypothetical protein